jgi:hypothetical protein
VPITEITSGTTLADGTEQTLDTRSAAGTYLIAVDLSAMVSGDVVTLRVKDKVLSGGSAVTAFEQTYRGAQTEDVVYSEPVPAAHGTVFTLQQTAGTNRSFPWSVRSAG